MNKKVAVLLVIYNEEKHIRRLTESLNKQSYRAIDVYAIDNNSQDNSVELLKKYLPDINLIKSNNNIGFAKGNNIIAKKAVENDCDYLFVLNTDMELDYSCVENLAGLIQSDPLIGGVAPIVLLGKDNRRTNIIQSYADRANFETGKTISIYSNFNICEEKLPEKLEVNTLHGGSTFISKEVYNNIGLFNEDNFMYGDELDLAYRLNKAGYKLMVTKNAISWHFHDWTKKNKNGYYFQYYYMMRNRFLFFYRYNKIGSIIIMLLKELFYFPIKSLWAFRVADIRLLKYYYYGILHGLLNRKGKANIEFK